MPPGQQSGLVVAGRVISNSDDALPDGLIQHYSTDGELDWSIVYGEEDANELRGDLAVSSHGIYFTVAVDGEKLLVGLR